MFWCLQLFIHVLLQFLTSLKLGHCSKLNWPKRVSAVYWLFGTLFYPWTRVTRVAKVTRASRRMWETRATMTMWVTRVTRGEY